MLATIFDGPHTENLDHIPFIPRTQLLKRLLFFCVVSRKLSISRPSIW